MDNITYMEDNKRYGFSRRDFLAVAFGAGAMMVLRPFGVQAAAGEKVDPRVAQILASTISVDMHNHVYPKGTEPHMQHGPPPGGGKGDQKPGDGPGDHKPGGGPPPPRPEDDKPGPDLHIESELKKSGLTAVCASFVLDFAPMLKAGDARANYLSWLAAIDKELASADISRALNLKDLQAAHDQKRPTIIQTVEGAFFIEGELSRIEEVYKRGLRHLQLLHEKDDLVKPLGDTNTGTAHLGGLTAFGKEVIRECDRLGIVVDLAHASTETVTAALKVTSHPVIVSHTNLDTWTGSNSRMAEMMKPRLISTETAKAVADKGGVIGVWTHLTASLPEFVDSIRAMVDAIGADHVGMGTDTDLLSSRSGGGTNKAWTGFTGEFWPAVVTEMLRQGFTPEEIGKIGGGNFCRVFDAVTRGK